MVVGQQGTAEAKEGRRILLKLDAIRFPGTVSITLWFR